MLLDAEHVLRFSRRHSQWNGRLHELAKLWNCDRRRRSDALSNALSTPGYALACCCRDPHRMGTASTGIVRFRLPDYHTATVVAESFRIANLSSRYALLAELPARGHQASATSASGCPCPPDYCLSVVRRARLTHDLTTSAGTISKSDFTG